MPHAIILDLLMHRLSGWAVLERLKGDPATAGIPVIVCSAASRELVAETTQGQELKCLVLPKPFEIDNLLSMVAGATAG